jgi:hypothetical protein
MAMFAHARVVVDFGVVADPWVMLGHVMTAPR